MLPEVGTDVAAQLARASFAREAPLTPVDFSWFGGVHPFGYSVLAPVLMAVLGVALTGLLATVALSVLFARLLRDSARPLPAAVMGAVFAVANDVSGRTSFALGGVAALAALLVLPRRRWAGLLALLTGLLSPVAAAFLGLVAAVLVLRRRPGGWTVGLACTLPVTAVAALFPGGGVQPYSKGAAVPLVLLALALAYLSDHPLVRTGALLYAVAVVFFTIHLDPFGSNVQRLGALVGASLVIAYARRLTPIAVVVLVGSLVWQLDPTRDDLRARPGPSMVALNQELAGVGAQRVEVVPARDHREAYEVAEHVAIARGWSRQIDVRDNQLFYRGRLTGPAYVTWLKERAVDHVAVPRSAVLDYSSTRENRLLRDPVEGLRQVWQDADWTLYAVEDARPLADATVVSLSRTSIVLQVDRARDVQVRVRWSPWLTVDGPACVERVLGGVVLKVREAGTVTLTSSLLPGNHC